MRNSFIIPLLIILLTGTTIKINAQNQQKQIYLWEEGKVPTITKYTERGNNRYQDPPGFRPDMIEIPFKNEIAVKGAVLLCSGGAFAFRGNDREGIPVAEALSRLGYKCFIVNYRVQPFTMQEGALDLARAVRYVRSHSMDYGINEKNIAVMGFSAGGILCGELLLNFDGTVNGASIDPNYLPDKLDKVSADASAVGMVYSFYGRLSVASTDIEKFRASDLPPTYFIYGSRDPFVNQFELCVDALRKADIPVESHVLKDWPHGFGAGDGKWIIDFDRWLMEIFNKN